MTIPEAAAHTGPMTITEFLEARIAEDEDYVKPMVGLGEYDRRDWAVLYGERVLAECAAKRRVLDLYEHHRSNRDARRSPLAREAEDDRAAQERRTQEARTRVAEDALRTLAAVYSSHPDYQQEWAL